MPFKKASATNGVMFIQQKGVDTALKVHLNVFFVILKVAN